MFAFENERMKLKTNGKSDDRENDEKRRREEEGDEEAGAEVQGRES